MLFRSAAIDAKSNYQASITVLSDSYASIGGWTQPLTDALQLRYGNAGMGFLMCNNVTGVYGPPNLNPDWSALPSIPIGANWTMNNAFDVPLFATAVTSNANSIWFTNTFQSATNIFYYYTTPWGGNFTVTTNGVAVKTISGFSAGATNLAWTNINLTQDYYSLGFSNVAGTNFFVGIDSRTTNAGVRFYNHGHSGSAAISWTTNTALTTVLSNESPTLVIVDLGRNDQLRYGNAASIYNNLSNNLSQVIATAKSVTTNLTLPSDYALFSSPDMTNDVYPTVTSASLLCHWSCAASSNSTAYVDLYNAMPSQDRKNTRLNSSHVSESRMPSSA